MKNSTHYKPDLKPLLTEAFADSTLDSTVGQFEDVVITGQDHQRYLIRIACLLSKDNLAGFSF